MSSSRFGLAKKGLTWGKEDVAGLDGPEDAGEVEQFAIQGGVAGAVARVVVRSLRGW